MNAKQKILEYIGPAKSRKVMAWVFFGLTAALAAAGGVLTALIDANWTGALFAIAIIPLGLWIMSASSCSEANKRAKRCLKRLEELDLLESAAAELDAGDALVVGKDSSRLTEHFAFRKHSGVAVAFDDVRWVFIYPGRDNHIPITTNTKTGASFAPVSLPNRKANVEQIQTAFAYLAQHCNNAMVGYNDENLAKYREIKKHLKTEAKAKK